MSNDRYERLKAIRDAIIHLEESPLYEFRIANKYFPVIGQGNHYAKIMFVGEAPGKQEAIYGRPFCGAAGNFLDELLKGITLKREEVYITNIVKDRPPENRDPTPDEIDLYAPFLDEQIAIIQPQVIATLGRHSMKYLFLKFKLPQWDKTISQVHGQLIPAKAEYGDIFMLPLFHPAYALYDGSRKGTLIKDFDLLRQFIPEPNDES